MRNIRQTISIVVLVVVCSSSICFASGDNYFFVFLNGNPNAVKLDSAAKVNLQAAHLANITRLYKLGFIKAAGPFESSGGIFIFQAASMQEVNDSLQTDAAIAAGRYILEVYPMTILKGKLCPVGDEYDLEAYPTVRLLAHKDAPKPIPNNVSAANMDVWFDAITKQADILFAARFDDENGGGFIVTDPKRQRETTLKLSPRTDNIFSPRLRNLWIAFGTFCETR